jgi:hypothetical protein
MISGLQISLNNSKGVIVVRSSFGTILVASRSLRLSLFNSKSTQFRGIVEAGVRALRVAVKGIAGGGGGGGV